MRNAEEKLTIISERGQRGLPLERVYRLLFRRDLYLRAYAKLYANDGAMTPGSSSETVDGMSLSKIDVIIEKFRCERYRWTPVRRTFILKKNGKKRPLGMPTWSDKLLQEVMRSILAAYYEPQFSPHSHGFRSGRGCHTALRDIWSQGRGTKWFIEGDLSACFDKIDHSVLIDDLREKIYDGRFIQLVSDLIAAGYLEQWTFNVTHSGVPQGGIISPILSNLVLNRLDRFVETELVPANTRGRRRKTNPEYARLTVAASHARKTRQSEKAKALLKVARQLPSRDPRDKNFRRLWYVRYADDFLLGLIGPKTEAKDIKGQLARYLRDELKLKLNAEKTFITHAPDDKAKFLGYEVHALHCDSWRDGRGQRNINGGIGLRVPKDVVEEHCSRYMRFGKPMHLPERLNDDAYSIIARYQAEVRGVVQYYQLAYNVRVLQRLKWVAQQSLTKTLANKWQTTTRKVYQRLKRDLKTADGTCKVLQVTVDRPGKKPLKAHFGAIPMRREKWFSVTDVVTKVWSGRSELLDRLLANECELCGVRHNIEVHHVRKLADLNRKGRSLKPDWEKVMVSRKRKTLVVCRNSHNKIHAGAYDGRALT